MLVYIPQSNQLDLYKTIWNMFIQNGVDLSLSKNQIQHLLSITDTPPTMEQIDSVLNIYLVKGWIQPRQGSYNTFVLTESGQARAKETGFYKAIHDMMYSN